METIRRSWRFAKLSLGMVRAYPGLLAFPFLSALAVAAAFLGFLFATTSPAAARLWIAALEHDLALSLLIMCILGGIFIVSFIVIFFNSALVACVLRAVDGQVPTVSGGLAAAMRRLPAIAAWAIVAGLVGVVLGLIENSSKTVARAVALLFGAAWGVLTYFVIPVLVVENLGPSAAIRRSAQLIKESWGKTLVSNVSLVALSLPILMPLVLLFVAWQYALPNEPVAVRKAVAAVGAILLALAIAVVATAGGVLRVLLYGYASGGKLPPGVDLDLFATAFVSRPIAARQRR